MSKLERKVAIVTGAAGAIGRACAAHLAAEGASVVLADLPGAGVDAVARAIQSDSVVIFEGDVSSQPDVVAMVNCAVEAFGGIDILHNNAALTDPAYAARDLNVVDVDLDVFDRAIAVNLRGPLMTCKEVIPLMLRRGGGTIINTSSVSSMFGDLRSVAYAVSKGGLNTLTQYVATQFGKDGIRCNAIAPGVILTPGVAEFFSPELISVYEGQHLTPTLGSVDDVAALVVYLASDDSRFMTGQIISLDGGLCAHMPTVAAFRDIGR